MRTSLPAAAGAVLDVSVDLVWKALDSFTRTSGARCSCWRDFQDGVGHATGDQLLRLCVDPRSVSHGTPRNHQHRKANRCRRNHPPHRGQSRSRTHGRCVDIKIALNCVNRSTVLSDPHIHTFLWLPGQSCATVLPRGFRSEESSSQVNEVPTGPGRGLQCSRSSPPSPRRPPPPLNMHTPQARTFALSFLTTVVLAWAASGSQFLLTCLLSPFSEFGHHPGESFVCVVLAPKGGPNTFENVFEFLFFHVFFCDIGVPLHLRFSWICAICRFILKFGLTHRFFTV